MRSLRAGLVIALLGCTAAAGAAPATKPQRVYRDDDCGFHLKYAAGWVATKSEKCAVTIAPEDLEGRLKDDDVDVWTVEVSVHEGTLIGVASDAGFDFRRGHWILGAFNDMPGEAEAFEMPPWWGIRGWSVTRVYHRHAGYAGMGETATIIAQSATPQTGDARVVKIHGYRRSLKMMNAVLRSFRFAFGED